MPERYSPDGRPIHRARAGCAGVMCAAGDHTQNPLANGHVINPVSMRERAAQLRQQSQRSTAQ
jgi:hypothetical protein